MASCHDGDLEAALQSWQYYTVRKDYGKAVAWAFGPEVRRKDYTDRKYGRRLP